MNTDPCGKTIANKYELTRLLGAGGMGRVFEARHLELRRRVAVKLLDAAHAGSHEVAERFRREARASSAVESEHIVQVLDVGKDPELGLYIVMELLQGEDLERRLARVGRLGARTVASIGLQAARGLAKAHAAGVIHRDLKPANVFLTTREDGSLVCKIVDFGVSKLLFEANPVASDEAPSSLTRVGGAIGTPQYMSPEQAQALPTVDLRTDIWSLGAVLFEALAGVPLYPMLASYELTIIRIVTTPPPRLAELAPGVPAPLAELVQSMVSAFTEARPESCAEVARRLADMLPQLADEAPATAPEFLPVNAPPSGVTLEFGSPATTTGGRGGTRVLTGAASNPSIPESAPSAATTPGGVALRTSAPEEELAEDGHDPIAGLPPALGLGRFAWLGALLVAVGAIVGGLALLRGGEPSAPAPAAQGLTISAIATPSQALKLAEPTALPSQTQVLGPAPQSNIPVIAIDALPVSSSAHASASPARSAMAAASAPSASATARKSGDTKFGGVGLQEQF